MMNPNPDRSGMHSAARRTAQGAVPRTAGAFAFTGTSETLGVNSCLGTTSMEGTHTKKKKRQERIKDHQGHPGIHKTGKGIQEHQSLISQGLRHPRHQHPVA